MLHVRQMILLLIIAFFPHIGDAFVSSSSYSSPLSREAFHLWATDETVTAASTTTPIIATDEDDDDDDDSLPKSVFVANIDDQEILSLPMFIDESSSSSSAPLALLTKEEMILIAKRFLASSGGLGGDPSMLSPSFTFEGPVVGPLGKQEFVDAIGSVDFKAAFPDYQSEFYGFHVDPFEGDRVWYTARGRGKNTGPLVPFVPETSGTGKTVVNPPQVCSITLDHSTGLITKYTIGYVVDRTVGNTGGLGGLYGILYALGRPLPFPEAKPWQKSIQYDLFQKVGGLLQKLQ